MKIMVIDGNSILNRAFYGIRQLTNHEGLPTNAVYGFLATLFKLQDEEQPDRTIVCFDVKEKTFRHLKFDTYKATRKGMPDELAAQLPITKQVLDALGIVRCEKAGYEADDLLGTISRRADEHGDTCVVVTGDRDSLQLVGGGTTVMLVSTRMGQTTYQTYDTAAFREKYGFDPIRLIDLKALMGDSSDNIPGVPGIGEKTAKDLLVRFGTVADIYRDLDTLDIKPGVRKKLTEGRESAQLSFDLATIRTDAPIDFAPESAVWDRDYRPELYDWFRRLGFLKLSEKWGLQPADGAAAPENALPLLPTVDVTDSAALHALEQAVTAAPYVAVLAPEGLDALTLCDGKACYALAWAQLGDDYNAFLRLLFSDRVRKAGHNIKDLMRALLAEGLPTDGFVFDTALAAYLLDATAGNYDLPRLAQAYLGGEAPDAQTVWALQPVLREKMDALGMLPLYTDIELPLCPVLARMEHTGFLVDRKALYDFGESLTSAIEQLQQSIWACAGEPFNIQSPKQLGHVLFDELMLPAGKKTKTGWSTNAAVLEKLRGKHPIIDQILDYRMLTKLKSTYADGLLKEISADGRIHTNFQMTVTATGRLSSTEPNLQNIPTRTQLGSEFRRMFVPASGCVLVDADYSQIELRLLAHIADDEAMKQAFLTGEDIHTVTAAQVFGVPTDQVTKQMRSHAKAVNFGIVYGISAFSLAQDIGVPVYEAKAYIETYFERFPGIRRYMDEVVAQAKERGYVETLMHRRRALPELAASNFNTRSFGERVARNMPIQGTAADVIKLAMVRVDERLHKENLKAKLILQVHDELIVECPEEEKEAVARLLTEEMEGAVHLSVPLTAEAHWGINWLEAK